MTLLSDALALATRGLPVFPCLENKSPACAGGLHAASTDPAEVRRLFANPQARLIGIPAGPVSGFDAIDIDVKRGGLDWWEANRERIPPTEIHHTRSGGVHVLLAHTEGMRTGFDRIAPGVEIRGEGGYIIHWPAHGLPTEGEGFAPWPDWLHIQALRGRRDASAPPAAPEELAPPSAAALVEVLNAMPNPADVTRGDYTGLNLAVQGCIRALDALGRLEDGGTDVIQDAAAEWSARWDSGTAADIDVERDRWDSDWSTRTHDVSGWQQVLGLAGRLGVDVSGHTAAIAAAEFPEMPPESESKSVGTITGLPAPAQGDPNWESKLARKGGKITGSLENAYRVFNTAPMWHGVFRLNTFASRVEISRAPPFGGNGYPREIQDTDLTLAAVWLQSREIAVSPDTGHQALTAVAMANRFSPVREYLSGLIYDAVPRIDTWLIDHLGAADTELNKAFGAKFLISAVARAMNPGCQVDSMLVVEGRQGLRKSTALRVLFGSDWFTDHIPDLGNKDAAMQIQGVWLLEHAEMATLGKADAARAKEFITRRVDRFRSPYGRVVQDFPRQCVFAATVNPGGTGYLKDETGARRYWPVECGAGWPETRRIDTEALSAARDSLWAEAFARYHAGEAWWLDRADLETAHTAAAAERYDADPWADQVAGFVSGRPYAQLDAVFQFLGILTANRDKRSQMRLGGVMRSLGWVRTQRRIEGRVCNMYAAPTDTPVTREPALAGMLIECGDFPAHPIDKGDIGRLLN